MRCSLNCLFCGWVMSHLTRNGSVKGLKLNRFSFRESPAGRIIGWPVLRIVFGSRKLQSNETQEHTVGIQSGISLSTVCCNKPFLFQGKKPSADSMSTFPALHRRGSTPVSTVLRKSFRFFITNIFFIIKKLSKLKFCSISYTTWKLNLMK